MDKITVKAPAKINLTLDVLGRRENGYHDLRMIMQTIDLCDEVTIEQITAEEITLSMNKELPDGCPMQKNLVYRAAILMKERYALPDGMNIILTKNIPAAAGLAGGSSDCAQPLSWELTNYINWACPSMNYATLVLRLVQMCLSASAKEQCCRRALAKY